MKKNITIAIGTAFQDAGDATRAIEIAKGIKKYKPKNVSLKIIFLSHGSKFEKRVEELGFEIYQVSPKLAGKGLYEDLKMTTHNLIGDKNLAREMILGEIEAYKKIKPNVVLHGFWPMAGIARRMQEKEIPGICFIPLPLTESFFDVIPDVPEQIKIFQIFPKKLRMFIFRHIPKFIKQRIPLITQKNIRKAAYEVGWKGKPLLNIFDLLRSDVTIVNDLPDYYDLTKFPKNVFFSGPLFSKAKNNDEIDPEILKIFNSKNKNTKIFCTLSSSGSEEMLKEVIKTFTYGESLNWDGVILSPHYPLNKAKRVLGSRKGVYITDKFVPAKEINELADVVICHGGQGTLQTAISSGTPLVGVAMQQEQFINLCNLESKGVAIRIPKSKWNSKEIQKAVSKIISNDSFKKSALKLKKRMLEMDGEKNSAKIIWKFLEEKV